MYSFLSACRTIELNDLGNTHRHRQGKASSRVLHKSLLIQREVGKKSFNRGNIREERMAENSSEYGESKRNVAGPRKNVIPTPPTLGHRV